MTERHATSCGPHTTHQIFCRSSKSAKNIRMFKFYCNLPYYFLIYVHNNYTEKSLPPCTPDTRTVSVLNRIFFQENRNVCICRYGDLTFHWKAFKLSALIVASLERNRIINKITIKIECAVKCGGFKSDSQ